MNKLEILKNIKSLDDIKVSQLEWEGYGDENFNFSLEINGITVNYFIGSSDLANKLYDDCENKDFIKTLKFNEFDCLFDFLEERYADKSHIYSEEQKAILNEIQRIVNLHPSKQPRNPNFYYPLPECVTIKESLIHGNGLFATEDIPAGTKLGISHREFDEDHGGAILRTALGDWYNHSTKPNCVREDADYKDYNSIYPAEYYDCFHDSCLTTIKDIKAGEELTATYTLYNPE